MKTAIHLLCAGIFWIWNLCFLLLIYFGLLPLSGFEVVRAMVDGTIPFPFVVSLVGILVVPPVCTGLGFWRLRRHPVLLMRLFYGIEAPLLGLLLLRLFVLRETTPGSAFVLAAFGFAIATFALELFFGYAAYQKPLAWFQMATHSLVLMVGLYVGGILLFYTVPALCVFLYTFVTSLLQGDWWRDVFRAMTGSPWHSVLWGTMSLFLFGFSCTLFVAMPYGLVNLYTRSWGRILTAFGRQHGWRQGGLVTGGVAIATLLLFIQTQAQPQVKAFQLLDPLPQTEVARQAVLAQSETVRQGLTNAYLQSYRYLSPWPESNALASWYQSLFNLSLDQARFWQNWHNRFLSPFLYQGQRSDDGKAAQLYAQVFDQPIQKAERQPIQQALQSTVNREETKAGLLNINQEIVYLAQQQVSVQEQGDWAEVTLFERYENNTPQDQEIFYSFSLPESAVITGLWLGDDLQPQTRYPFVVSPRGAAQKVYNEEVERGQRQAPTDPALLEQVGPQQYRLRVFPIPPRNTVEGRPGRTDLWLTYKALPQNDQWPLPQLTEKRSIYWDRKTAHLRPQGTTKLDQDTWLEAGIPVAASVQPRRHQAVFPEGYRVIAEPLSGTTAPLQGQRLALVMDTSYSMQAQSKRLAKTVQELERIGNNNTLDWYVAGAEDTPQRLDKAPNPKDLLFFGSLQLSEMLKQFEHLQESRSYDAIILVTDEGSYELANNEAEVPPPDAPLWVLHLGGHLPSAYQDAVLQAIQASRGGVATEVSELLQRLAMNRQDSRVASVADGYVWRVEPVSADQSTDVSAPDFIALAARQLILKLGRDGDMGQLEQLDRVHAIAKRSQIVTPYSSMLVLVDARQREALRQAEASADRFKRQVETGNDTLTQPANLLNDPASAPEPGVLLGLGGLAAVLWLQRRSQNRKMPWINRG
ncbi:TIGR02921 family PEP-CTERM protein [Pseudanabaena sp. FACHB-2040]|uniref:TIGR02921 family PEP-CTERM protein n=1 Tax=Pseudanabaena sp. FACHB-2040 TaxID=2692859 RepID=UPI001684F2B3|nr:TIGR02921 family PEP-CTERM protein [Pseudanabaena sp. FACHB-2040]MBD2258404.1 TIGR02921 family PEP-CTERM protein [Pseudanabaena sp. FACHB-2040]